VSDDVTVEGPDEQAEDQAAAPDGSEAGPEDAPGIGPEGGLDLEARAEDDPRTRAELLGDLDRTEAQRDEYLDDLRRSHADFENYRKRVARDAAQQREQGRADVVGGLLEVLDDLDRVVGAAAELDADGLTAEAGAVVSGVRVVADKAQRALEALGVERVADVGVPFDPTVHDAVQQVDGDGVEQPTVHEVLRPGYRSGERVVRAAMVVVAQ
jgi:molecular chaperone GrpE